MIQISRAENLGIPGFIRVSAIINMPVLSAFALRVLLLPIDEVLAGLGTRTLKSPASGERARLLLWYAVDSRSMTILRWPRKAAWSAADKSRQSHSKI